MMSALVIFPVPSGMSLPSDRRKSQMLSGAWPFPKTVKRLLGAPEPRAAARLRRRDHGRVHLCDLGIGQRAIAGPEPQRVSQALLVRGERGPLVNVEQQQRLEKLA